MSVESLLRFDRVRLLKILEISYYAILSFLICLIVGNVLENDTLVPHLFKNYDYDDVPFYIIFLDILKDIVSLVVVSYYTTKLLKTIPFVLASVPGYVPSKKGEVDRGVILGTGLVFYTALHTLSDKIRVLNKRITTMLNDIRFF